MPRRVEFQGRIQEFPDNATDDQIRTALMGQQQPSTAVPEEKPGIMSDIGDTLKQYWDKINPVTGAQSVAQAVAHPIDAARGYGEQTARLHAAAQESFKKGDYAEGLRHTLSYFLNGIPGIGSVLDEAGNKAGAGDIKGAIADTAALATNIAGPKIAKAVAPALAQGVASATQASGGFAAKNLMRRALKPGVADAPTLADARAATATALENEIPVSEKGVSKLQALIADYAQKTQAAVDARSQAGHTLDPGAVASRLDQVNTTSALPEKPTATVTKAKQAFLARKAGKPIPFDQAQAEKQGSYQKLKNSYSEMSTPEIEAEKALARGYKEEMEAQAPELKLLNAKESEFFGLQPALERAVRNAGNRDIVGMKDLAAGGAGTLAAGPIIGPAGAIAARIGGMPELQSRLAIMINKASRKTSAPLSMAQSATKAAAILNQLSVLTRGDQQEQNRTGATQ